MGSINLPRAGLLLIIPAATLLAAPPPPRDAAPLDPAQVLRELDALSEVQARQAAKSLDSKRKALARAAQDGPDAADLYKKAVEELENGSSADVAAWIRRNADLFRSDELRTASMLHTRYLLLGLEARQAARREDAAREASAREFLAYAGTLADVLEKHKGFSAAPREARDLLDKPAREGVFARWLALAEDLPDPSQWEERPGALDGILEKNVRAPLRPSRDPAILAAWDLQIGALRQRAASGGSADAARIEGLELPRAIHGRARDKRLIGLPHSGLRDILALVREHPGHPDWEKWAAELRAGLGGGEKGPEEVP